MSASTVRRPFRARLTPLAAALAAVLPSISSLAAGPVNPNASQLAGNAVPVPGATWRTYGNGPAKAPVNVANSRGGIDQTIGQTTQQGIYNWQSFNIGAASSVTFDMTLPGASALNRVTGAGASQIFGHLTATNNGQIYLINANGILFGSGSIVNTGSLIASGLDITDDNFKSSLVQSITAGADNVANAVAFQYGGDPAAFIDERNFVRVDSSATIATSSGGRVFLFAKKVDNEGTITTPDGQTALAAGSQVYLRLPSTRPTVYAAESNPNVPVLRGLLVEVGDKFDGDATVAADAHLGTVTNGSGALISTPRGNATLVGLAVNQLGRVSATTSASENGTIFLRAQGNAAIDNTDTLFPVVPRSSGTLTLGGASHTDILPDTQLVDGKLPTSNDNAGFIGSRIDLQGKTVELKSGASVVAPGATVNVRAVNAPDPRFASPTIADPDDRIVMDAGARIDVSGTTDTTVGVDRYFVTTDLLTSSDLQDAPLQKDGLLYRAKVTLDIREDSLILGDLSRYRATLQRTADERMSAGGKVNFVAQGAVLLAAGSQVDVSGGQVHATAAMVDPTKLVSAAGGLYDLDNAPSDLVYTLGLNLQKGSLTQYDRWGALARPGTTTPATLEPGYVQGAAAGAVSFEAPTIELDGALAAHTGAGTRQLAGQDALAGAGRLTIGSTAGFGGFEHTQPTDMLTLLQDFAIARTAPAAGPGLWSAPLTGALPEHSGMAMQALADSGFGIVTLSAHGDVSLDTGNGLALADHSSLTLESAVGNVALSGNVTDHAGSISLGTAVGRVDVAAGSQLDLSGRWINQLLDAKPEDASAIVGGTFLARGERGVALGKGSLVDVSGGATVTQAGALAGGNAGAITLLAGRTDQPATPDDPLAARSLAIGGTLRGQALQSANGAALTLRAPSMRIGVTTPGSAPAAFRFDPGYFTRGGFSSFSLDGLAFLDVSAGTTLAPTRSSWWAPDSSYQRAATGSRIGDVLASGASPLALAPTVGLTLKSSGVRIDPNTALAEVDGGRVGIAGGSRITLVPGSSFTAQGASQVEMDGTLVDHGGAVTLASLGESQSDTAASYVWLGSGSMVDVSGTTLVTPSTDGLRHGTVQDGGSIALTGASPDTHFATSIVVQDGARLALDGTRAALDVNTRTNTGVAVSHQTLASNGGRLSVTGTSDILLEGRVSMKGGGAQAAGGSLSVNLTGARDQFDEGGVGTAPATLPALELTQAATHLSAGLDAAGLATPAALAARNAAGTASAIVSAQWVQSTGAADLELDAPQVLHVAGDVSLTMKRNLVIDAAALAVDDGSRSHLGAANVVVGNAKTHADPNNSGRLPPPPTATAGTGQLAISATDMVLDGRIATQQVARLTLAAKDDLRLQASLQANADAGSLTTAGDLVVDAGQVYPVSGQSFAIEAPGRHVAVIGGDPTLAKPLSAGGALTMDAALIDQDGVLRAPFGSLTLNASDRLSLGDGSETSVSGDGLTVSYGSTSNGATTWGKPSTASVPPAATALPAKTISLSAPAIATAAGASVDLSGGGTVVGYEFIPGPGGSHDVFAGGDGAYAIVPGVHGIGPYDPSFAGQPGLGTQLVVGASGPIPAGTYTLLPARYALLPGAFLVKAAGGTPLAEGASIANADGSSLIGARTASANTGFSSAATSTWRVQTRDTALRYSQIQVTDADGWFASQAAKNDAAVPRGAADGGVLQFIAGSASLGGSFRFTAAPGGLGGIAGFSADKIVIADDTAARTPGTLTLSASQLDAMAPATLLLGATVGTGDAAGTLGVVATDIDFENAGHALSVGDLIAAATGRVEAHPGAAIVAASLPAASATSPVASFSVAGNGAALRVSNTTGAGLTRTAGDRSNGSLLVDSAAKLDAGAGSLVLDGTLANTIAGNATLHAADITLAAGRVLVGNGSAADSLVLGAGLLGQVNDAEHLALRGYDRIAFLDATTLGGNALSSVTLDTGRLLAFDANATVGAGEVTLANTTGVVQTQGGAGDGMLTIHADGTHGSGHILLGDGTVAVNGVQTTTLQADRGLVLAGSGTLAVGGDLIVRAPRVLAQAPDSGATSVADVTLNAPGTVNFIRVAANADATASASGAALTVDAARVFQGTTIDLPSGQLTLAASNGSNGNVTFTPGSRTALAGSTRTIDGTEVYSGGGTLSASALAGNVLVQGGATIDVSAAGDAAGGKAAFGAAAGTVTLAGSLSGRATDPARGAQLVVDAKAAPSLDAVAAIQQSASGNFTGAIDLRQRGAGAMALDAGRSLAANQVAIDNDGGSLTIAGHIDAGGATAGSIDLAARDDLVLAAGGTLAAHATGANASGGRLALTTAQGRLSLADGATIDLASDAAATNADIAGGRLTLRAPRTATEVAIDAIGATVRGASAIDVQAVKVYDGFSAITSDDFDPDAGALRASVIGADSLAFVGASGSQADAIANRLAAGHADVLDALRVHAEAEVRSSGNLVISTPTSTDGSISDDFVLPTESADLASTSKHVGDTSLTLRAAGDVTIARTVSAGFAPVAAGWDERSTPRTSAHSGEVRIVAGSDLSAAAATRTVTGTGTLAIGRDDQQRIPFSDGYDIVAVRATSGDVTLAAGKDIDMRNHRVLVYTAGHDVSGDTVATVRSALVAFADDGRFAFTVGAGDVSLAAGGSVLASDTYRDPAYNEAQELASFRSAITETATDYNGLPIMIDGKPSLVDYWSTQVDDPALLNRAQHGVASFGGGRVGIAAGQDVVGVEAVSPSSGYAVRDLDGTLSQLRILPGGDVSVRAGRDVVDGLFETGAQRLTVDAGRDIAYRASTVPYLLEPGVRMLTENGSIDASARRDASFGYVESAFYSQGQALTGLDGDASARVTANGGDMRLLAPPEFDFFDDALGSITLPARTRLSAPHGSLSVGELGNASDYSPSSFEQHPVDASAFEMLAGKSVDFVVAPSGASSLNLAATPDLSRGAQFVPFLTGADAVATTPLDESDRTTVHIAAETGDLTIGTTKSARPLRMYAGNDLTTLGTIQVTQQPERLDGDAPRPVYETSSMQAGRDLRLSAAPSVYETGPVVVSGPGEFLLLAGRDVDLGHAGTGIADIDAAGIIAAGNTLDAALPNLGANVTIVAGLRADGSDYDQATRAGFEAIGANALTDRAGDLYAQLGAKDGAVVPLGSAAAAGFSAAGLDGQLAQVKALLGAPAYDAALAAYVRSLPGQSGLSDAQALAAFATLSAPKRGAAPGAMLAQSFMQQPQATRDGFVAEVAVATPDSYGSTLVAYMKKLDGRTRSVAQAIADFESLPLLSRMPLLDAVLVDEMRTDGRAAAAATGSAQEIAYDRGYRTLATLFPVDRPDGSIEMPEAAVKTQQQANVTMLAPGGGVDAGGLGASDITPNHLGIVTVAGGDISAIVRDDFLVNRSRVFTLQDGNLLIWSSEGNIDAGRGAKTIVGAPAPVLRLDSNGQLFLDTSGSFTGSGIAVLDAKSSLDLYAPAGAIDAGEAGIKSAGNAYFAAQTFLGADNLQVGGASVGAPPATTAVGATAGLASAASTLAGAQNAVSDDDRDQRRKRRTRRNLLLEFLGFGSASN